jgi:hypothetical protein
MVPALVFRLVATSGTALVAAGADAAALVVGLLLAGAVALT